MKDTLKPGIEAEFTFRIPPSKTVPALYPESPEFQEMPMVFATGFMVGFIEWACIKTVIPISTGRRSRPWGRTSTSRTLRQLLPLWS